MSINRIRELAGLPAIITEGPLDTAMSRGQIAPPPQAKVYGLYIGQRGSGKLEFEVSGDMDEVRDDWEALKNNPNIVGRIVPLPDPKKVNEFIAEGEQVDEEEIVLEGEELVVEAEKVEEPKDEEVEKDEKDPQPVAKTKVPADVLSATNKRIAELKAAIEQFDKNGANEGGAKQTAVEALEQILDNLKKEDGLTKAVTYYGTLTNVITVLFPPKLEKFLHAAPKDKKVEENFVPPAPMDVPPMPQEEVDNHYDVAPVEKLKKGEFVKRKPDARKVYTIVGYDRSLRKYQLDDHDDISRCIWVKAGTPLVYGFTY
jgi:hypothetical protein